MQPEPTSPLKKIIVIVVVIAFIGTAIYFFVFNTAAPATKLDPFGNPVQAQVEGADLVDLLTQLENVKLNEALFNKQAFINLTDYAITLGDEPQGRPNPFEKIH